MRYDIDEPALELTNAGTWPLSQRVFGLHRTLAKQQEEADARLQAADAVHAEALDKLRLRLARLAAEVFQLERFVASAVQPLDAADLAPLRGRLQMVLARFRQAMTAQHVELPALEGEPLEGLLAEMAEVIAAVPGATNVPRVKEVIEPLVRVDGAVVLRPTVIVEVPG